MGRPEGPGCYCAANNIIRKYTDRLSESYPYVVIDNEAGMEHLSRRTSRMIDLLLIVSDPSSRGIRTAKRIHSLVDELILDVDRRVLLINRVTDNQGNTLKTIAEESGMQVAGMIPQDPNIAEFDLKGNPVLRLPDDSPALKAVFGVFDGLQIP
jgi:CO dehydrogenase maturation factor